MDASEVKKYPYFTLIYKKYLYFTIKKYWFLYIKSLETPFGEIPVLEIDGDGFLYAQSNAIQRYIAKKYGTYILLFKTWNCFKVNSALVLNLLKSTILVILFLGFAGKTELEQLRVDMIIDYIDDLLRPFTAIIMAKTEEQKVNKTDSDLAF